MYNKCYLSKIRHSAYNMWWCLAIFFAAQIAADDPIATTAHGKVRGVEVRSYHNKTYYAFIGIPYATPPVGNLRFQDPLPPSSWHDILETKSNDKICIQWLRNFKDENEDCLYLSVHTPVPPGSNQKLPVIVNIYGGGFLYGWASRRPGAGRFIVEKGVILVDFNYRVGPFGFLSTHDSAIPGNMGLKDQQLALRWVQQNIAAFGGDPSKVTIMGQSAGAASVTYHLLSPTSAGLFRAAIAQSGSALCGWAHQTNAIDTVYEMASAIHSGITKRNTTTQVLKVLQSVPVSSIKALDRKFYIFAPVIDGKVIDKPMYDSVKSGHVNKVPLLIGSNSEECIGKAVDKNWLERIREMDVKPEMYIPGDLAANINHTSLRAVGATIRGFYTDGMFKDHLGASAQYDTDNRFVRAIIKYAELHSNHADVYFYRFAFQGKIENNNINVDGVSGVGHGEDLKYLNPPFEDIEGFPWEDRVTVDRYVTLFTNFAKTMNPTPVEDELFEKLKVPRVKPDNFYYLNIDRKLTLLKDPRHPRYKKWVSLFDTYAKGSLISY